MSKFKPKDSVRDTRMDRECLVLCEHPSMKRYYAVATADGGLCVADSVHADLLMPHVSPDTMFDWTLEGDLELLDNRHKLIRDSLREDLANE